MIGLSSIPEFAKRIEEIKIKMECPKNFECLTSPITNRPKMKDLQMESYVKILGKHPLQCDSLVGFGKSKYCKCPMQVYITKNLKK